VIGKQSRITVVVMDDMETSDDQMAPTLRSAEVWGAGEALSGPVPSPRPRSRRAPEVAVVEPSRPAWPGARAFGAGTPDGDRSLLSLVAREVGASLLEAALAVAERRRFWS
jgi:hypothetical protein